MMAVPGFHGIRKVGAAWIHSTLVPHTDILRQPLSYFCESELSRDKSGSSVSTQAELTRWIRVEERKVMLLRGCRRPLESFPWKPLVCSLKLLRRFEEVTIGVKCQGTETTHLGKDLKSYRMF